MGNTKPVDVQRGRITSLAHGRFPLIYLKADNRHYGSLCLTYRARFDADDPSGAETWDPSGITKNKFR